MSDPGATPTPGRAAPPHMTGVAPILLVRDLPASLAYFRGKVGFGVNGTWGEPPCFAIIRRDRCTLMLATAEQPDGIVPNWKLREKTSDLYIWVDDAEAIYDELRERGANIDYELYEAPHGCLEFGIQDLDDHDLSIGQVLDR